MWRKIVQNFNSLRCLVLEISSFEFADNRGFRADAGVNKNFVGGASVNCTISKFLVETHIQYIRIE